MFLNILGRPRNVNSFPCETLSFDQKSMNQVEL